MSRLSLAVLLSGAGTTLQALLDAISAGDLDAEIRVVLSNKPKAYGLERARAAGIACEVLSHRGFAQREAYDVALVERLARHEVDWVVLAGFMRLLSPRFLAAFPHRVINVHPALLPAFPGAHAVQDALDYGVKITGCTVHLVDEGTDTGPILAQRAVTVLPDDDADRLHARIREQERRLYPQVLQQIAAGRLCRQNGRFYLSEAD
ncbi:MAG: phosphoribosylglycinamide formyltransferase [Deltaproteobacteria bacterium]|nr:phosphoribosylglycinamide formyltransferase [Deltaproteobacteria bacterium]